MKSRYRIYIALRGVLRVLGLAKPLRNILGPLVGKVVSGGTTDEGHPVLVHGHMMVLTAGNGFAPADMVLDRYEVETTKQFEQHVTNGMAIVDVGAHVGYFTLIAAKLVGSSGQVFAFEPDPINSGLLMKNIELNGYANIEVTTSALSSKSGNSTLYRTSLDSGRHSLYRHDIPVVETVEVETTTLDEFLESRNWPAIGLVKMDVEGSEPEVLAGMKRLLERSENIKLILEFNIPILKNAGTEPVELLETLMQTGFRVSYIDETKGAIPLPEGDHASALERLMDGHESANLLFSRGSR